MSRPGEKQKQLWVSLKARAFANIEKRYSTFPYSLFRSEQTTRAWRREDV